MPIIGYFFTSSPRLTPRKRDGDHHQIIVRARLRGVYSGFCSSMSVLARDIMVSVRFFASFSCPVID